MTKKLAKLSNGNYRRPTVWGASFEKQGIKSILHPRRWSSVADKMKVGDRIIVARNKRPMILSLVVQSKTATGVRVKRLG